MIHIRAVQGSDMNRYEGKVKVIEKKKTIRNRVGILPIQTERKRTAMTTWIIKVFLNK